MNKKDCFKLGYVIKRHGFKGELSIKFDSKSPEKYKNINAIFIEINNTLIPYFIERLRLNNKGIATIKFEDVNNDQDTEQLLRKNVYLPLDALQQEFGILESLNELVGFEVIDETHGNIGILTSVIDQTSQIILQVEDDNYQILIPAVDEIINSVDTSSKTINVATPDGLVELYKEG